MKRTNINLTDDDQRAIRIIRQQYGLTNDAAAIRLALARTAGKDSPPTQASDEPPARATTGG